HVTGVQTCALPICPGRAGTTAETALVIDAGVAELVVGSALLVVGQHLVGFFCLFEFVLGHGIARVTVRVIFHGQAAIGFLDVLGIGSPLDTQHFVVIPL